MTIIYAILIFCFLIFVHEFGHFIVAKACGVRVNEFSLGMGPAIFSKTAGETKYSLRILPIGGYCAMEGEDEESEDPKAFVNQPAWQRACVLVAGAFMNLLTCVILLIIIAFWTGSATNTIDRVEPGMPAYESGIVSGDKVLSVDGKTTNDWEETVEAIGFSKKEKISIEVERDGEKLTFETPLVYNSETGRKVIGVRPEVERSPGDALINGVINTGTMTKLMCTTIKQLFTGDVSVKELSGPVGIVYATNEAAKSGILYVVYLAALLSLNLAIINMLPLPALDGGRVLFLVIRLFTGKRVSEETEGKIHFIGICLLFALMIYVTFNDVIKFILPIF